MFKIHCGGDWFFSTYQVAGAFYLQHDDYFFPCENWNDLPMAMLEGWCEEIATSLEENETINLWFLDGDYMVRLLPCSENVFRIEFIEDEGLESEKIVDTFDIDAHIFLQEVLDALDVCIAFETDRGKSTEKLHAAKETILHLKRRWIYAK
ncbi:MAG: hypothetical protein J6C58_05880 [Bacteroidaceae bacterium]|nr:hypothetical protein [Bacteroidaceae bacterium]